MKVKFIQDASIQLADGDGRLVVVSHRNGEEVELGDSVAGLFLSQGAAIPMKKSERAVKPKGERR